jgi:hypothetical protein
MRMKARLCTLVSLGLLASAANGHETLPSTWCMNPATHPVIVSEFSFDSAQLQAQEGEPDPNCGVVGRDPWRVATDTAHGYCASYSTGLNTAMPIVLNPASYNNVRHHHALYDYSQGLQGACVVCVPNAEPINSVAD